MTERLRKCVEAGSMNAVAALIVDWPVDELNALVRDCGDLYESEEKRINDLHGKHALKPHIFFSKETSSAIDAIAKNAKIHTLGMLSEICAIAYLCGADEPEEEHA